MHVWVYCGNQLKQVTSLNLIKNKKFWEELIAYFPLIWHRLHSVTMYGYGYRWGLDWWMDLLTTYTHGSELQAITAPLLIFTIHVSPQHPPKPFFQPAVFISCSLATASNSGDSSASCTQVLSSQPPMQNSNEHSSEREKKEMGK
jgi:hypothetical protein